MDFGCRNNFKNQILRNKKFKQNIFITERKEKFLWSFHGLFLGQL